MDRPSYPQQKSWLVLIAFFTLFSAACSVLPQRENVPVHTYVLTVTPGPVSEDSAARTPYGTLLVNLPRARAGFDTAQLAYVQRPHEIEYFAYNQWADTPARMLRPLLIRTLDQTGAWLAIVQTPASVQADYQLDTEILLWQQEFLSQPSQVRLAVRAQLVQSAEQGVVATRRFEVVEPAPSDDPYGGVTAANRAAPLLTAQIAEWVNESVKNKRES